jgi:hypothetical protein
MGKEKSMQCYTYLITHVPSGQRYYGSQYGKNADPSTLWTPGGYFTSSKVVQKLIEQDGVDSFTAEVRRLFDTPTEAIQWESKVLTRLSAARSDKWLNRSNGKGKFYNNGLHSEETKRKMSEAGKRRAPLSEEHKKKLSES